MHLQRSNCAVSFLVLLIAIHSTVAIELDKKFFDLFSLSDIYDDVKFGDVPKLREVFLEHHSSENTARLLYALATAIVKTSITTDRQYKAEPFKTSVIDESTCRNQMRYGMNQRPNIGCHFTTFVICVEGILKQPVDCLDMTGSSRFRCPEIQFCKQAYGNVQAEGSRAWLQLWAEETMADLKSYGNYTAAQIAALPRKSSLHDTQFLSAVYNLALCSEISRQASVTRPRIVHPLSEIYCPDPCLTLPCAKASLRHLLVNTSCSTASIKWESQHAIAHSWDDLKLQRQHRIRPPYSCFCRVGSWVASKETCEREEGGSYQTCAPTLTNRHFPCSAAGTSLCFDNKESEEEPFICRCKQGYVGVFCQDQVDTCFHKKLDITFNDAPQRMTGNRLCNVNHGGLPLPISHRAHEVNRCTPDPDTRHGYRCECVDPFFPLIRMELENCLGVRRACDTELCINGVCAPTPDQLNGSICRCSDGWGGDSCNQPLPDWTHWTTCWPVCGQNRTRRRERRGDMRRPERLFAETELCPNRYCVEDSDEEEYISYQTLLYTSSFDSCALAGSALLALITFSLLRFWRPRFAHKDAMND